MLGRAPATLALGVAVLALSSLLVVLGQSPPSPRPASAPARDFSASRAFARLERVLAEQKPHPVGSEENRRVRERIEAELTALGLDAQIERGRGCNAAGTCAEVENVVAKLPSRRPGRAIVVAAHYDSVASGPGAADDGAGVATALELARALRADGRPERPVWLLFTDGEEAGMLGAELFVENRARLRDIELFVNLEARGVRGPSLMFEASRPNLALVGAFGRSAERPVASSLFYAVYRALPNDSDLTVFRRAGLGGANFAFIGGAEHYHGPRDDLRNLSLESVQHQGDLALALVRELSTSQPDGASGDAVFFDLGGRALVVLSVPAARALTALSATAALAMAAWALRRRHVTLAALSTSLLAVLGSVAFALLAGIVTDAALRQLGVLRTPWPASGVWIAGALHTAAFAALCGSSALVGALDARAALVVHALVLHALAVALAALLPEAVFTALVPGAALVLLLGAANRFGSARAFQAAALAGLLPHALVWAPIDRIGFDALGVAAPALSAAIAVLVLLPLLPLVAGLTSRALARLAVVLAAQSGAVVATVAAFG